MDRKNVELGLGRRSLRTQTAARMNVRAVALGVGLLLAISADAGQIVTQVVWNADFTGGTDGGFVVGTSGSGTVDFSGENMDITDPASDSAIAYARKDWSFKGIHEPDGQYVLNHYTLTYRVILANTYGTSGWTNFRVAHLTDAANSAYIPVYIYVNGWGNKLDFNGAILGNDLFAQNQNATYAYTITHNVLDQTARVEITHPTNPDYDSGVVAATNVPATRLLLGTAASAGKGRVTFDNFTLTAVYTFSHPPGTQISLK